MVSGRAGYRGPSDVMKSQSQAGSPLKVTERLPAAPCYRTRAGKLWSPGLDACFANILLNTALPIRVCLSLAAFMLQQQSWEYLHQSWAAHKCQSSYGLALQREIADPWGEARFCWGLIWTSERHYFLTSRLSDPRVWDFKMSKEPTLFKDWCFGLTHGLGVHLQFK